VVDDGQPVTGGPNKTRPGGKVHVVGPRRRKARPRPPNRGLEEAGGKGKAYGREHSWRKETVIRVAGPRGEIPPGPRAREAMGNECPRRGGKGSKKSLGSHKGESRLTIEAKSLGKKITDSRFWKEGPKENWRQGESRKPKKTLPNSRAT